MMISFLNGSLAFAKIRKQPFGLFFFFNLKAFVEPMARKCTICGSANYEEFDRCMSCRVCRSDELEDWNQVLEPNEEFDEEIDEEPAGVEFLSPVQVWQPGPYDLPPRPFLERLSEFSGSDSIIDSCSPKDRHSSNFRSRMPFWMAAAIDFCRRPPKPIALIRQMIQRIRFGARKRD